MTAAHDWTMIPARRFLRMCRRNLRQPKVADSTGAELSGAGLLMRTLILQRLLHREILADDETFVGLLLPPSTGAVVANAALAIDRRVAVNLNYTVSSQVMDSCLAQSGIRHVLTSRKVMQRLDLKLGAEVVYLEDFKDKVTTADKVAAAVDAWAVPVGLLERRLGLTDLGPDDLLTVIFTSGSTGEPKGAMLTNRNVATDVDTFNGVLHLDRHDVLVGVLPFFHSFGYTVTMWSALMLDPKGAYHFSPLESRQVGAVCRRQKGTLLVATPTFLRTYLRRCEPEDFATLEIVVAGAEKLPSELSDSFEKRFGVRPVEGYGTTELSPAVACNVPPNRRVPGQEQGCKEGTVGQLFPGISAKVIDLDSGEELGPDKAGMLWIKGPVVMQGYLGQPEKTAEVLRDGWYITGDVATIDAEGYIRITGRVSRFSKIGGEMVPHGRVEEALMEVLKLEADDLKLVVTAVPDAKKGERLIVLHTGLDEPPETICRQLAAAGLPPLWIPSPDSFLRIEEIPVLGTGKLDLKRVKQVAEENVRSRAATQ